MVWQALQSDDELDLDKVLERFPATMTSLYEYLAQEVLDRQPEELRSFLLSTSVLRQMDAPACCAVSGTVHSSDHLHRLHENGLFVDSVGGEHFRYQGLFHEFLLAQLQALPDASRGLHQKAAAHYLRVGNSEEAVYHLLESGDYDEAARTVIELGPGWIQLGRLDSLTGWIARLPDDVHTRFPTLLLMKGDTSRLRSQFAEALEQYSQAERCFALQNHRVGRSKALQGQAQVYLDTIRPLKADSLLEEAIRLLEPQEFREMVSGLLDQLAENKLNLGHPEQARALHHEAGLLRSEADPGDIYLEARALLRTGKLEKARQLLQARADEESRLIQVRPPRFHRETLILLSLVCIMMGDAETAGRCARQGIAIGQRIESPFVEAVGLMRLGHTCQLDHLTPWSQQERLEAIRLYYQAIEKVRVFNVMRVQVEPLWGLCRVYGYQGDLDQAESFGWRAVEIAEQAGDRWFVNLLLCTMGASLALAGKVVEARERLAKAVEGFEGVKDTFGQSAALLWLSLNSWWHGDIEEAMHSLAQLLPIARREGYDFLLTRCTHLGLKDDQQALPLLIEAGRRGIEQKYCSDLLQRLNLTGVEYHPGHTLVVRTLGRFEVRKADLPITPHEWQREKARQLFQLILTERGRWLQKEQIVDRLWPDLPPDAAARDLKVALNALNHTLEPNRPQRAQSFFIARQENQYGLNPQAHVLVDTEEMDRLASSTEPSSLRQALCLYGGEYLPDSVYGDWSEAARQRYRNLYLTTAERLAKSLAEQKCWDEVISLAENILKVDAHWEPAYILLMRAYAADHNRGQVYNTYRRCKAVLHEDLDIEPAAVTQAIYKELTE